MKRRKTNTRTAGFLALGSLIFMASIALLVGFYELNGSKSAPLYTGELDVKITGFSSENLKKYANDVGMLYPASSEVVEFYAEVDENYSVDKLKLLVNNVASRGNMKLIQYDRKDAHTVVENRTIVQPGEFVPILSGSTTEMHEKLLSYEQFTDAVYLFLKKKPDIAGSSGLSFELKVFKTAENFETYKNDSGANVMVRRGGVYKPFDGIFSSSAYLLVNSRDSDSGIKPSLYELEYY